MSGSVEIIEFLRVELCNQASKFFTNNIFNNSSLNFGWLLDVVVEGDKNIEDFFEYLLRNVCNFDASLLDDLGLLDEDHDAFMLLSEFVVFSAYVDYHHLFVSCK